MPICAAVDDLNGVVRARGSVAGTLGAGGAVGWRGELS